MTFCTDKFDDQIRFVCSASASSSSVSGSEVISVALGLKAWKCSDQGFRRRGWLTEKFSTFHEGDHHPLLLPSPHPHPYNGRLGQKGECSALPTVPHSAPLCRGSALPKLWVNFQNKEWGWTGLLSVIFVNTIIQLGNNLKKRKMWKTEILLFLFQYVLKFEIQKVIYCKI